jgi:chromosomal replication initiator protein
MVFTCDRPLSELNNFQERIISRLSMGSMVDLVLPNFETRCAILFEKLRQMRTSPHFSTEYISDEIIKFIAEKIVTNIRDLEGALKDVVAFSSIVKKTLVIDDAKNILRNRFEDELKKNFTINDIQKSVANYFNISFSEIKGKGIFSSLSSDKIKTIIYKSAQFTHPTYQTDRVSGRAALSEF